MSIITLTALDELIHSDVTRIGGCVPNTAGKQVPSYLSDNSKLSLLICFVKFSAYFCFLHQYTIIFSAEDYFGKSLS
jgi:hypothetical protein